MNRSLKFLSLLVALMAATVPASAFEVKVTIENVSPEGGTLITPMWLGFHMGQFDSYDGGAPAADFPGLEQIAEDGNSGPLSEDFAHQVPMGAQATVPGPNGPIFPGDTTSMRFDINPDDHRYLSYVSMVIPSNDAFVANGNPTAHRVFDTDGNFTGFEFYISGNEVNDAGTEVNDEIPEHTAALNQTSPNTGVDENGVITDHPGFIEGGNILDAIPNGQFVLPGYVIAKVTVTAVPTTRVSFRADDSQQAMPTGSTAIGACTATLNSVQTEVSFSCEHNVEGAIAAHIHLAPVGSDGPVVLPFEDLESPLTGTLEFDDNITVDDFFGGNFYLNIHTDAFPAGEIRGQVDGCFEGPGGLCLNGDRFQVTANWQTLDGVGTGVAAEATADSGFFTFFSPNNIELDVKVLDACDINGNYWVFAAGLTDVGVELIVEDTLSGQIQTYTNQLGTTFQTVTDTAAFNTCP